MSRKIKHDQYEIVVQFKTDNILSMHAQFLPTNQHFSNDGVQLMRINKDTVLASLERKSQKNLRCEFQQIVTDGNKLLQITFIVNFDFLPQFREEVRLNYVQFKENLKTLNLVNMKAQLDQMDRALQSIENNGTTTAKQLGSFNLSTQKKQIWSMEVNQGKYILRACGTMNNTTGIGQADINRFYISVPGQKQIKQIVVRTHHQSSYQFPFFFSQVLEAEAVGDIKVDAITNMSAANLFNVHFVLNRVTEIC